MLLFRIMSALFIDSFPEDLHAKLRRSAAAHGRSVASETIHLIEVAILAEAETAPSPPPTAAYWKKRPLLPEYEALLVSGALSGGMDSSRMISQERDSR